MIRTPVVRPARGGGAEEGKEDLIFPAATVPCHRRTISLQIMYVVAPQGPNVALALKPVYLCAGFYPIEADNLLHAAFLFAVWKARRRFGPGGIFSRLMVHAELTPDAGSFEATLTKGVTHEPYRFTVLIDASGRREMVSPP